MPSQRLLKILDPWGHVGQRRVLASTAPKALVWATDATVAAWLAAELRAAHVEPLLAQSFRHVQTSLRMNSRPVCDLAVIDFTTLSDASLEALTAVRWDGYTGPIIAIGTPTSVPARLTTLLSVAHVAAPGEPGLRDAVTRILAGGTTT